MDKSVPRGAAMLLDFIYRTETKAAAPACYDVIYGHNQGKLAKPLTSMTFGDVVASGKSWTKRFKSSAAGAAQFMRATLIDLAKEIPSLRGDMLFDGNLQDRLALHLLKRRGYDAFMAGKISRTEFGKRLAQEWASLPVLKSVQGAHRVVKRGETYYAGDALNKSLVSPATVESVLDQVYAARKASAPAATAETVIASSSVRTDSVTVEIVQRKLFELGYSEVGSRRKDGSFDGAYGDMTKTAILAFRNENGLPLSDVIDDALLSALDTAAPRKLVRKDTTPEIVRENAPEVRSNWLVKIGAIATGGISAAGAFFDGVLGNLSAARAYVKPIEDLASGVPPAAWMLAIVGVAAGVYLITSHGEKKGVDAYRTGERR